MVMTSKLIIVINFVNRDCWWYFFLLLKIFSFCDDEVEICSFCFFAVEDFRFCDDVCDDEVEICSFCFFAVEDFRFCDDEVDIIIVFGLFKIMYLGIVGVDNIILESYN